MMSFKRNPTIIFISTIPNITNNNDFISPKQKRFIIYFIHQLNLDFMPDFNTK